MPSLTGILKTRAQREKEGVRAGMLGIACNWQKFVAHMKILLSRHHSKKNWVRIMAQSSFQLCESLILHVLIHFPPTNLSFFQKEKVTLEEKRKEIHDFEASSADIFWLDFIFYYWIVNSFLVPILFCLFQTPEQKDSIFQSVWLLLPL